MFDEVFENLFYIFSEQSLYNIFDFIEGVSLNVRSDFFPIFDVSVESFLMFAASVAEFLRVTNIVVVSFGIASTIWIAKKAFKWFRQMAR